MEPELSWKDQPSEQGAPSAEPRGWREGSIRKDKGIAIWWPFALVIRGG